MPPNCKIRGHCDVCEEKDGFRGHNLQQCKTCGVLVHEACYGLVSTRRKRRNWECKACEQASRQADGKRATACVLCLHSDGMHAMHPIYDNYGPNGKQVDRLNGKLAWAHTACCQVIGTHASTKGCVYACDSNGDWYGDSNRAQTELGGTDHHKGDVGEQGESNISEVGNEATTSDSMMEVHHFVVIRAQSKDPEDKIWAKTVKLHQSGFGYKLKCNSCRHKDNTDPRIMRIALQCAGEKCARAMHVGCARWKSGRSDGTHVRNKRVKFFPGSLRWAELESDPPVSLVYCESCVPHQAGQTDSNEIRVKSEVPNHSNREDPSVLSSRDRIKKIESSKTLKKKKVKREATQKDHDTDGLSSPKRETSDGNNRVKKIKNKRKILSIQSDDVDLHLSSPNSKIGKKRAKLEEFQDDKQVDISSSTPVCQASQVKLGNINVDWGKKAKGLKRLKQMKKQKEAREYHDSDALPSSKCEREFTDGSKKAKVNRRRGKQANPNSPICSPESLSDESSFNLNIGNTAVKSEEVLENGQVDGPSLPPSFQPSDSILDDSNANQRKRAKGLNKLKRKKEEEAREYDDPGTLSSSKSESESTDGGKKAKNKRRWKESQTGHDGQIEPNFPAGFPETLSDNSSLNPNIGNMGAKPEEVIEDGQADESSLPLSCQPLEAILDNIKAGTESANSKSQLEHNKSSETRVNDNESSAASPLDEAKSVLFKKLEEEFREHAAAANARLQEQLMKGYEEAKRVLVEKLEKELREKTTTRKLESFSRGGISPVHLEHVRSHHKVHSPELPSSYTGVDRTQSSADVKSDSKQQSLAPVSTAKVEEAANNTALVNNAYSLYKAKLKAMHETCPRKPLPKEPTVEVKPAVKVATFKREYEKPKAKSTNLSGLLRMIKD